MIISTGKSRTSKSWKREELLWAHFAQKLTTPVVGEESMEEYLALTRNEQLELKDVGGFLPGELKGSRRKNDNVENICMLSLDIDFGDEETIPAIEKALDGFAYVVHTTRKDRPGARRFRLMAPYSRPVEPTEGIAIMRRIAERIGMKYFDKVSFESARLMFWPSVSRDQKMLFKEGYGEEITVDQVLATYTDYKNMTEWPRCPDEEANVDKLLKAQVDPLEKEGLIGDICRAYYPLSEHLEELLPGVYEKVDGYEDRYTYIAGTSAAGMIIYDDKFIYSHHESDPAYLKLCNAFDLIREHKFKITDTGKERTKEQAEKQALKWAAKQNAVVMEKSKAAAAEFEAMEEEARDESKRDDKNWTKRLDRDDEGNEKATLKNLLAYMTYDKNLKGVIRMDSLAGQLEWNGAPFKPTDYTRVKKFIEARGNNAFGQNQLNDGINMHAEDYFSYNPLLEKIHSVEWDKTERAATLFIDLLGAEDNIYTREATFVWLMACYSRIVHPGKKFDNMIVLVDETQGVGKSTILNKLAFGPWTNSRWFTDNLPGMSSKNRDNMMHLQGRFIVENAELASMGRQEIEDVKAFITQTIDQYRGFGSSLKISTPRTYCFAGTTNNRQFLKDESNRRFWPIDCHGTVAGGIHIAEEVTEEFIAQIWAEIAAAYKAGRRSLMLSDEAAAIAFDVQRDHEEKDDEFTLIVSRATELAKTADCDPQGEEFAPEGEPKGFVATAEIIEKCKAILPPRLTGQRLSTYIGKAMREAGWERKSQRVKAYGNKSVPCWFPPEEDDVLC